MKTNSYVEQTVKRLKSMLETTDDISKMELYWKLLKEVLNKNHENMKWGNEHWTTFLTEKLDDLDKRIKEQGYFQKEEVR